MRYSKDNKVVLVDTECRFIYEVLVYVWFDKTLSLANSKLFYSEKEIPNIIESYFINEYIEFFTTLYAAPKDWLIKNDFEFYIRPKKKTAIKKEKNGVEEIVFNKSRNGQTVGRPNSTRTKKLQSL